MNMSLEKRFNSVKNRVNSSNQNTDNSSIIDLLAVSKKQPLEKIVQLYNMGQRMFGESYIQEAIDKIEQLSDLDIQWHYIGPIQSNKTKYIAQYFSWVQSVDSVKLLTRLNRQRAVDQKQLNILLQLKVGGEDSKRGLSAPELLSICAKHAEFEHLSIRGLMSIPAPTSIYSEQKAQFKICQNVFQQMQEIIAVDTLSMGMSSDLEAAIACGSTMVRIGTDIFGKRVL
ncbi:MAG: YggS family pyridoxal phosphate-dependent enzyme [Alcanivoracaceae bacterium]|nr:YggS family pyridoxal phosphate-dependent enzyme [Alcanivoracaceae bacterium]